MLDLREASKAPLVIRVCACVHACRYRCRNVQSGSSSSTASCWRTPEHWLSSFMSLKITTLSIHSKALYGFPSTSAAVHSGWNSQAPWEAGFTPLSHFTDGDTEAQRGKLIWPNAVDPGLPAPSSETCGHIVTAWRNQAGIRCHTMVVPGQGGCAAEIEVLSSPGLLLKFCFGLELISQDRLTPDRSLMVKRRAVCPAVQQLRLRRASTPAWAETGSFTPEFTEPGVPPPGIHRGNAWPSWDSRTGWGWEKLLPESKPSLS